MAFLELRCFKEIGECGDGGAHRSFVHVVQADDDEARTALLASRPGTVVILVDAGANGLDQQAHRLAGHVGKALEAQHVML